MSAHLRLVSPPSRPGYSEPPAVPIRIVLVDVHDAARRSLRRLLDAQEDFEVIAEAADLSAVWRQLDGQLPPVLVLDFNAPDGSGIERIRRLRERMPETEIVVLTMDPSPELARQAIDTGAIGFVLKDKADTELLAAVRNAAKGREYVSSHVAAGLEAMRDAGGGDGLSPRETEVLRSIALGYTSAEIATRLQLSRNNVEAHRARIYAKLGFTRRAELVQFALLRHLVGD